MRFIRSKGYSFTEHSTDCGMKRHLFVTRGVAVDKQARFEGELHDFAISDPQLLIRQFISAIDKTLKKPKEISRMTEEWYCQRENLGAACWQVLVARYLPEAEVSSLKNTWRWKLHPYAVGETAQDDITRISRNKHDHPPKYKGRWHAVFWETQNDGNPNYIGIANSLEQHLFREERTIDGRRRRRNAQDTTGLIQRRAMGIGKSVYQRSTALETLTSDTSWTPQDQNTYCKEDVALKVFEKAKEREKNKGRLVNSDVGQLLYEHFEIIGLKAGGAITDEAQKTRLFVLHGAIKEFYKARIKASKRGKDSNQSLTTILPKTCQALFGLLTHQRANRLINDLIRHGRFAYYSQLSPSDDAPRTHFWTSEGQAQIKRSEAFTRVWRNVISQAARTAKSWADPSGEIISERDGITNDDILAGVNIKQVTGAAFSETNFTSRLDVLFGSQADGFRAGTQDARKNILEAALKIASRIRTGAVHFSNRSLFVAGLIKSITTITEGADDKNAIRITAETQDVFNGLLANDTAERQTRLVADLEGVLLHQFADTTQIKNLVDALQNAPVSDLTLPRFNRMLDRHDGTREISQPTDGRKGLPDRANTLKLTQPAAKCKFASMKLLYERCFGSWVSGLDTETLKTMIKTVIDEGAARAKHPQGKNNPYRDQIRSKAVNLPNPGDGGLVQLFDDLAREIATELRQQNAYEPNPEKAREQSAWIEHFKCDLMAVAFAKFLKDKEYDWLLNLVPETAPEESKGSYPVADKTAQKVTAWEANLYLFLHLVPVDDVARLLHQFRKTAVLEGKAHNARTDTTDTVARVMEILVLYMEMHNAKFDGDAVDIGRSGFLKRLMDTTDFNAIYNDASDQEFALVNTRRGLRQIMRFGHMDVVCDIFAAHRVKHDTVTAVLKMEAKTDGKPSPIEVSQKQRQELHRTLVRKTLVRKTGNVTRKDFETYRGLVDTIATHRQNASMVRLTDHARLHQILMRVIARLIDYAGIWERDKQFVFIALIKQQRAQGDKAHTNYPTIKDLRKRLIHPDWLTPENRALFDKHFGKTQGDIRNNLAHFNILAKANLPVDLTQQVNNVRSLMSYDRKLKNAVSKSVKELLLREGITLTWKMQNHHLQLAVLKPKEIPHLTKVNVQNVSRKDRGGIAIWEDMHSPALMAMLAGLFNGKAQVNANAKRVITWTPPPKGANTAPKGAKTAPNDLLTGKVKWYNATKGFGFIQPDEGGKDDFVHISALEKAGLVDLADDQRVSYTLEPGRDDRVSAQNLRLLEA